MGVAHPARQPLVLQQSRLHPDRAHRRASQRPVLLRLPDRARPEQSASPERCIRAHSYGYGLFIGTIAGAHRVLHPGDNPGYVSFNAWLPDTDTTITVLSNDETTSIDQLGGEDVVAAVGRQPPAPVTCPEAAR